MPIYVFVCKACNKVWEEWFSGYTTEGITCRICGGLDVIKKPTSFSLHKSGESSTFSGSSCGSCKATSCSSCTTK